MALGKPPVLSIVIPAYNEEERIKQTLKEISHWVDKNGLCAEIIVIDDGSTDDTVRHVKEMIKACLNLHLIQLKKNMGKGFAIRTGVLAATGRYILFSDADLSTPIYEAEKLLKYVASDYDIAIASRKLPESNIQIRQPWYRALAGKVFSECVKLFVLRKFSDTQCGFKMFTQQSAHRLFKNQKLNGFSFDVEVLYLALKCGYKVKEVPVSWLDSKKSSIRFIQDSIRMFVDLLRIRLNYVMHRYNL